MLLSFNQQLAKAKRRKAMVLMVPVSTIEQAAAAARAAEAVKVGMVLVIDASQPLLMSLEIMTSITLTLARVSDAALTVVVKTGGTHIAIEQALLAGAQAVIPEQIGSQEQYLATLSWASARAQLEGAVIIAEPSRVTHFESFADTIHTSHVAAVQIKLETVMQQGKLFAKNIRSWQEWARVALLVSMNDDHTPQQLRNLRSWGVEGIYITEEFDQAFTAGVRAALRNRYEHRPPYYLGRGGRSVEDKLIRYIQVCSM